MAKSIEDYYNEWEKLLNIISDKGEELYTLKNTLLMKEQEILDNTDFKEIYGKNNSEVRKSHLKQELQGDYDAKHELEKTIDDSKRRIEYIKSLMNMQMILIDAGVIE